MPDPALRSNYTNAATPKPNELSAEQYNLNATRTDTAFDNAAQALADAAEAASAALAAQSDADAAGGAASGAGEAAAAAQTAADEAAEAVESLRLGVPLNVVTEGGIDNTGATDVRAAIQALVTANAGVRPLLFPAGRYRIGATGQSGSNRISVPSNTYITCDEGAVFEINAADAQAGTAVFYAAGTDGVKADLTTNIVAGAQSITLPAGQASNYSRGDLVGVESLGLAGAYALGPFYRREIRMVMGVTGDVLRLDAPLEYAYATTDTAQFWKLTPVKNIVLDGMRFESGPGVTPGTTGAYPIKLIKVLNAHLRNVSVHNMIGGIALYDCYDGLLDDINIDGLPRFSDAFGYGVFAAGSTTNLTINNLRGRETRHVFTTIADMRGTDPNYTFWGGPMHVQINGGIGYGAVDGLSIWDTHDFGRHIHFNQTIAVGGGALVSGFQMRAQEVQLNNCRAIRCGLRGVVATDTSKNVHIIGGEYAYNGGTGITFNGEGGRAFGPRVHHNGSAGIGLNATTAIDNAIIDALIFENAAYGILDAGASGSTRSLISNCHIPKSTAQTTAIANPSATSVIVGGVFTGYGANQHGIVTPAAGCKINNITTDSGLVGNGILYFGPSGGAPSYDAALFRGASGQIRTDQVVRVGSLALGDPTTQPTVKSGSAAPEGSVTANPGSVYMQSSGGAGTTFYLKESGTGNTGWLAVATTASVSGKQDANANLTALAGLTGAADRTNYFTAAGAMALATLTAFGRSLIDDADAAAGRVTLGGVKTRFVNVAITGNSGLSAIANQDYFIRAGTTTVITLTLPTAVGNASGNEYIIKNVGTADVILATTSSQAIDGIVGNRTIPPGSTLRVISDNAVWWII